jgi:histone H3/H4
MDEEKDMLDGEDIATIGGEDELSLPKATVYKLITEMLPAGVACPKETRDLLINCCVEFIHLVSSEANDVCERNSRKTISPEHVLEALRNLGFGSYVEEAQNTYEETVSQAKEKERVRGSNKLEKSGLTEEELLRQQEELFEQARRKYHQENQNRSAQNSPTPPETE